MTIPLDRLYHYIESIAQEAHNNHVIIYRFWPHGSKKIQDLCPLRSIPLETFWLESSLSPEIFCNDQEPLNYHLYKDTSIDQHCRNTELVDNFCKEHAITLPSYNFRGAVKNIWDRALLLHSEKNSINVKLYKSSLFIPVYYWSHGIIAQDWFRYARYVKQKKQVKKLFLIYNRAWSGTREYRLKFSDLLVNNNLANFCLTSFTAVDSESNVHYKDYNFANNDWKPESTLEEIFPINQASSHYSADFEISDYESTDIEVVLETLFDDTRWHLTEKTLRPIACGQPFILASTCGSLQYLKEYGFKTFDTVWNETYDQIQNPKQRLIAIIDLMKEISSWDSKTKLQKLELARQIAEHNKKLFFSSDFSHKLLSELKTNLTSAFEELQQTNTSQHWIQRQQLAFSIPKWAQYLDSGIICTAKDIKTVNEQAQKYFERAQHKIK